jgi:hypothetical protein
MLGFWNIFKIGRAFSTEVRNEIYTDFPYENDNLEDGDVVRRLLLRRILGQ